MMMVRRPVEPEYDGLFLYSSPQTCLEMIWLAAEHQQQIGRKLCKC